MKRMSAKEIRQAAAATFGREAVADSTVTQYLRTARVADQNEGCTLRLE
jgi:hypothetical protein